MIIVVCDTLLPSVLRSHRADVTYQYQRAEYAFAAGVSMMVVQVLFMQHALLTFYEFHSLVYII